MQENKLLSNQPHRYLTANNIELNAGVVSKI